MSKLASHLDEFVNHKVLCIGDVMLDRYVYGQVERISPEAPIPVLRADRETAMLGGAGNVARNIAVLGGKAEIIAVVGTDDAADQLAKTFKSIDGIVATLLADPSRPTTLKSRFVANGQQLLRADHETTKPIAPDVEQMIKDALTSAIKGADVVILSDYAKGVLTPPVISAAIQAARKAGKIVIVDPKGRDFKRYRGASFLTPNRKELSEATGLTISSAAEAESAARALIRECELDGILVKLGSEGVCLVCKSHDYITLQGHAREVFDVSGAGDTVIATLAMALASGFSPAEAAKVANIAGSIVVGKVGTAAVTRDEIWRELMHGAARKAEDKVVTFSTIADIAERWRKAGLKVGFTNGCFDLLHPGHISLLRQARAACDKLVVGLNSDASIKRLKGETRPVQNEAARSTVLASLADVDQVVLFDQDTPLELIKVIRPDVLVKGADYTIDKVVGAPEVQSWGGKVVLAQLVDGQSTTKTIQRMKS